MAEIPKEGTPQEKPSYLGSPGTSSTLPSRSSSSRHHTSDPKRVDLNFDCPSSLHSDSDKKDICPDKTSDSLHLTPSTSQSETPQRAHDSSLRDCSPSSSSPYSSLKEEGKESMTRSEEEAKNTTKEGLSSSSPSSSSSSPSSSSSSPSSSSSSRKDRCPIHGRFFTREEVAKCHFTPWSGKPCLVIHKHCVYSLENFSHPGGSDILSGYFGEDITKVFEEIGHSAYASRLLDSLLVGILKEKLQDYIKEVGPQCLCHLSATPGTNKGEKKSLSSSLKTGDLSFNRNGDPTYDQGEDLRKRTRGDGENARFSSSSPEEEQETVSREDRIDFSKPLLPQIWRLNQYEYQHLVDKPFLKEDVLPLMPYAWMEPFSKTHWWMIPLIWLPVVFYMSFLNAKTLSLPTCLLLFSLGVCAWTLVEYLLHRFVFHFPEEWIPDSPLARCVHFLLHAVHHMLPLDPLRLVVPPALFVILALPVYGLGRLLFPRWVLHGLWPGGLLGYIGYDMIHYSAHHCAFLVQRIPHIREMKIYHMRHHLRFPLLGFGVSSKFWDRIFHTLIPTSSSLSEKTA